MKLEAILNLFQRVSRNGNDWMALCPAHSDS